MDPYFKFSQQGLNLSYTADNTTMFVFIGLIAAVLLFVLINSIRNNSGGGGSAKSKGFNLKRQCRAFNLETDQYRILKTAIRKQKLASPQSLFTNGRYLNACLKRVIAEIEATDYSSAAKEDFKSVIFDIKQKISMANPQSDKKMSTRSIPGEQEAMIFSRTFPPFRTEIVGKTTQWVVMELPRDSHGDFVQFRPGDPIKVQYVKGEDKVYAFVSKVNDIKEVEGEMRLLLEHADTVKRVQLRKSPRMEFNRAVFFYKVHITPDPKKKNKKQASVDKNRRYSGTMTDISAGGCALLTRSPLPKGEIILIAFDIDTGNTVNVFGKIRSVQRDRSGSLMRIAFTKVSTKTLNDIKSLVFGFNQEDPAPKNKYMTHSS